MKQTAVEWIVSKLSITFQTMYSEEIEQAKEMEKEQIKDAYKFPNTLVDMSSEQYYNETYGKK
jgi:hypothetical protein